jgi:multicomponent Na+:H+ antiporter subunit A
LTVILFALIIYRLPRFKQISKKSVRIRDFLIASAFGAVMTTMVLKANAIQFHPSISDYFVDNSYSQAFGKNIVNVILVDFRALDTLGEVTVLSVAALGIFALVSTRKKKDN